MGKLSKNKGSNYELKISKSFSSWSGRSFYRTPGSGSWSSQRLGQNAQVGDIVAPEDLVFPFSVELKHHENVTLSNYMLSNGEVPSFFSQNVGDAVRAEKVPMLITHSNYAPNYLSLPLSKKFISKFESSSKPYLITNVNFPDYTTGDIVSMDICIVLLEDFFELYTVDDFEKGYKTMFRYWYKDVMTDVKSRTTGAKPMSVSEIDDIVDNL